MSDTSYLSTQEKQKGKWSSVYSMNQSNFGSLADIPESGKSAETLETKPVANGAKNDEVYKELSSKIEKKPKGKKCWNAVVQFFDLTLLKDPMYVNIMLGMSLAVFAELNFSLLTPFILADFNLNTSQVATFLSVLSIADILFRFLAPFIGDYLDKPPRMMYGFTLMLLIITRYSLLLTSDYTGLLAVSVGLGIAKGVRTVYMSLVIPSYVPIERLANASGIQMMVNGVMILIGGPILGWIRDVTGSYTNCIYVINTVTFMTILMWSTEYMYLRYRNRKAKEVEISNL